MGNSEERESEELDLIKRFNKPWECKECAICSICKKQGDTDNINNKLICQTCKRMFHDTCVAKKQMVINYIIMYIYIIYIYIYIIYNR